MELRGSNDLIAQDMKPYLTEISGLVADFNTKWMDRLLYAEVYPIPFYGIKQQIRNHQIIDVPITPDKISPESLYGQDAANHARMAFSQFEYIEGQHPVTTLRAPGVIVLESLEGLYEEGPNFQEPYTGSALINRINSLKYDLHTRIKATYPEGSRALVTQKLFKGISMLQLYRFINAVSYPLRQVGFTWAGSTTSIRKLSYDEAVGLIEKSLNKRPIGTDQCFWEEVIRQDLDAIRHYQGHEFRVRRPVAPHPRVQTYIHGTSKPEEMLKAHLPILVEAPGGQIPKLKPLKDWDRSVAENRQRRLMRTPLQPVVERLNLFVVL